MNTIASIADVYPLVRPGGVFLVIVGAASMIGALSFSRRYLLLAVGAGIAAFATAGLAVPLSASFGRPTELQIWALVIAVTAEMATIAIAGRALARRGERIHTLAILTIVGLHFAIMAPAFGPMIAALAVAATINAALGFATARYSLPAVWFTDGVLKTATGLAMYFAHYIPMQTPS